MKSKKYIFIMMFVMFITFANVYAQGEATLKNIKVNGKECTCTGYECSISLVADNATITYDLTDSSSKVDRLSGFNIDLLSELTTVKINVTNPSSDAKVEYSINITKEQAQNNMNLKSLKVNGAAMKVADDVMSYNYECEYDTAKITLEVVTADENMKVIKEEEYLFEEDAKSLLANFYVQAPNGEELEYAVVATRRDKPDVTLKSITLDYGTLDFDEKVLEYEITVPYNINELNVEAEPNNEKATVEIENDDLIVGENEIIITVTNEKNKTEYKIKVIREENIDKSVANLKELTVDEYKKLDFSENVLEYKLYFSEIPSKLNIHAVSKDSDSTISILQNENLKDGSKVIVKNELNESKIAREYILVIKKEEGFSSNKTIILISIIGLIITMAVLLFLEIHSKKEEKKLYLKKVFDLRKKVEKLKKEGKVIPHKKKKTKKKDEKEKTKEKKKEEEDLEII